VSNKYSLRIQGDNQFRFWISILTFTVSSVFVAQEEASKMLLLIFLFVAYSACYGLGHLFSKIDFLPGATHYTLTIADLVAVTIVIYITGGIQSPFFILYLVPMAVDLYDRSLFDFVFDCVLAFCLYGGLLLYQTIESGHPVFRMVAQMGFLAILTGFLYVLLFLLSKQEKFQKKLVSRHKTLAAVANTLCGSLSNSKQWIKRITSLIEEEIRNDGMKCRISIHKGNFQFMPPSGGRKEIIIPILVGECVFGSLIITHDVSKPLSETDQDFFSSIAVSLGLALHRAKLWEEKQERLESDESLIIAHSPVDPNNPPQPRYPVSYPSNPTENI